MKLFPSLRLALAAMAFSAIVGCSQVAAQQQQGQPPANISEAEVAEIFAVRRTPADARPDFTQETVRKLNPIVERSKLALDRFDELGPQLAAAREAEDKPRIAAMVAELGNLKANAEAAHVAFQAEKEALLARDEYYNPVVLGAMEQFVAEAPAEIADGLAKASH